MADQTPPYAPPSRDEHRRNIRTGRCLLTCPHRDHGIGPRRRCAACGDLARGYATINGERYCHPDEGPSCYSQATRSNAPAGES